MRGGGTVVRDPRRRLERLEARTRGVWPAEVEAAKARALARVRLKISVALDRVDDPAFKAYHAFLADDTPEQAAADTELLQRWARRHPATLYPDDGVRERIEAKLEELARRLQSGEQGHEPEDAACPVGGACRPRARMGAARRVGGG
jgi:hypothetical protein